MNDQHDFWSRQTSSLHPNGIEDYNRRKADELFELIHPEDRQAGIVDVACGAGELLEHLGRRLRIDRGIDFSASMIEAARQRLAGSGIEVSREETFSYLRRASSPIWISTGGINQYLSPSQQAELLAIFEANDAARAIYLFDTVDPLKYHLYPHGMIFGETPRKSVRLLARRWLLGGLVAGGVYERSSMRLPQRGMGYGYQPRFWRELAGRHDLSCDILGARFFEYAYHVVLRKRPADPTPTADISA